MGESTKIYGGCTTTVDLNIKIGSTEKTQGLVI